MKKFFSTVFWFGVFAAIGYYSYKLYNRIMSIVNISKTLPQYLENVMGEQPKVDINMNFQSCSLKVGFSKKILDKDDNIKEMIEEYINDFYPVFADGKIKIEVVEKIVKKEKLQAEEQEKAPEKAKEKVEDPDFDISLDKEVKE